MGMGQKKSDLAYQRDNFLLEFTDSECPFQFNVNQYKTIDEVRKAILACDEGLADWYSILADDDLPEVKQLNRRGIQRVKREKIYLKRRLAELLKMENKCKGGNAPR